MKIDWSKISTVLLDMDGTLLDLHFDNYFWREHVPTVYAEQNSISLNEARSILKPIFASQQATLNWYCVNYWSERLDLDIMAHKTDVAEKIAYRPNAQPFLELCQRQVNDLRLITNGHREVLKLKIERTSLDQYFDKLICSHELGAPKEDKVFWQELYNKHPFDPAETLFIDDSEAVLDTANDYGIKHLYSIAKPDSQHQRDTPSKYKMLENFLTN